eukprot:3939210-Rhodomonas_salina.2
MSTTLSTTVQRHLGTHCWYKTLHQSGSGGGCTEQARATEAARHSAADAEARVEGEELVLGAVIPHRLHLALALDLTHAHTQVRRP